MGMFIDNYGGHADPYHIHTDPVCNCNAESGTGHSAIVGVALDGYGIYGKFESTDTRPCDLDICHGHVGFVPASTTYVAIGSASIYHYHISDSSSYPYTWTLGCYGDPSTPMDLATCNSLYDGCGSSGTTSTLSTAEHPVGLVVKLWCPCFDVVVPDECSGSTPVVPPADDSMSVDDGKSFFISAMVEEGNTKGIQLYNPSSATIDVSQYKVRRSVGLSELSESSSDLAQPPSLLTNHYMPLRSSHRVSHLCSSPSLH